MLTARTRRSGGFTLAEVLISVALIAILASVTIPTVRGRLRDGYEDALVQEFDNVMSAIIAYRQNVGKFPASLDYLMVLPATPKDFCNVNLSTTAIANWHGPYLYRSISTSFWLVGGEDTVEVIMGSTVAGTQKLIQFYIDGADQTTADHVDAKIDGFTDNANGTLQVAARGNNTRMTYSIPARSGSC